MSAPSTRDTILDAAQRIAAERGAVDLSRCDYVEGFDGEKIAASVTRFGVAEWHFVKVAV